MYADNMVAVAELGRSRQLKLACLSACQFLTKHHLQVSGMQSSSVDRPWSMLLQSMNATDLTWLS